MSTDEGESVSGCRPESTIGQDNVLLTKAMNIRRLPTSNWRYLMIIYIPFGIILAFLRLCISLQTVVYLLVIPDAFPLKKYFLRIFQGVLGIIVTTSDTEELSADSKVAVVNRVSGFDHLVLPSLFRTRTVSSPPRAAILSSLVSHCTLKGEDEQSVRREAEKLISTVPGEQNSSSPVPLTFQPEPLATNGSVALLQFSVVPFALTETVQPILLQVNRPIGFTVAMSTVISGGWEDLLWTLFLPYTHFRFKVMPTVTKGHKESPEEFAKRVQKLMAQELEVESSDCSREDVEKWMEEVKSQQQQQQQQQQQRVEENLPFIPINEYRDVVEPLQRPRDYHLEYQIDQVYQIFPQVPRYAIREDLMRTGNLDATVLNIADGRLQYEEATSATPPRARSIRARQEEQLAARISAAERRQPAPKPPVKPIDMTKLSLQEKKKVLIETAKKRYLSRHKKS